MQSRKIKPGISLVVVIVTGVLANWIIYSYTTDYAGPITAALLTTLCTVLLRINDSNWKELGFTKPKKTIRLIWQIPLILVSIYLIVGLYTYLFTEILGFDIPDQKRFDGMEGNLKMLIKWLIISWIVGAFMEEFIFRGFLINYMEKLLGSFRYSTAIAVITQAFLFATVHYYNRGLIGAISIFLLSSILGFYYIKFKRNLWPLILAHGIMNTLSFIADYLGS